MTGPRSLPEEEQTPRARLREILLQGPATVRDLSQAAGLREKDVVDHLEHLARSARGRGETLAIEPARCLGCGYLFSDRQRLGKPGSCPACRRTRIAPPRFALTRSADRR
jgi:transcriptional regulator